MLYTLLESGMCQRLFTCTLWLSMLLPLLVTSPPQASAQIFDSIFPNDDFGQPPLRSKRIPGWLQNHCNLCISTYDPFSCRKCWNSRLTIVPIYANKRDNYDLTEDSFEDEKRAVPMVRFHRNSGCSCCYFSRFSNQHCCNLCSRTSKRIVEKRSEDLMTSDW